MLEGFVGVVVSVNFGFKVVYSWSFSHYNWSSLCVKNEL